MSDAPQGPGWWMADDRKWYPPDATPGTVTAPVAAPDTEGPVTVPSTPPGRKQTGRNAAIGAGLVALIALAGAGAWWMGRSTSSDTRASDRPASTTTVATASTSDPPTTSSAPAPPPTEAPVGSTAPPSPPASAATGAVDLTDPLVAGYPQVLSYANSTPGTRSMLPDHLAELSNATTVTWTEQMLFALAASYCNDWPSAPDEYGEYSMSEEGEEQWSAAVAPVLGISADDALVAIRSKIWAGYQFVCD